MKFHCMFEQSGTFKNEFKKLGYEAYDYDILNDYGETDYQIDLFREIEKAYCYHDSIFDKITGEDVILAFFPCIRFENQIQLCFRGTAQNLSKWTNEQKLEYDMKLHKELHDIYIYICEMAIVRYRKGLKMIIENPYSSTHYLVKYWRIPATFVDKNRTDDGDYFEKPTQYWFINCKPQYNFILEPQTVHKKRRITARVSDGGINNAADRSAISKDYANRFIREFILEERL